MLNDIMELKQLQWHPNRSNFSQVVFLWYQTWPLPKCEWFSMIIWNEYDMPARNAYLPGHLVSFRFVTCLFSNHLNQFSQTCRGCPDISPWISLGTFPLFPIGIENRWQYLKWWCCHLSGRFYLLESLDHFSSVCTILVLRSFPEFGSYLGKHGLWNIVTDTTHKLALSVSILRYKRSYVARTIFYIWFFKKENSRKNDILRRNEKSFLKLWKERMINFPSNK